MGRKDKKGKRVVQYDHYGREIKTHKIWGDRVAPLLGGVFLLFLTVWFLWALFANGHFWEAVLVGLFLFLAYLLILGFIEFVEQVSRWREKRAEMEKQNQLNIKAMELRIQTEKDRMSRNEKVRLSEQEDEYPDRS